MMAQISVAPRMSMHVPHDKWAYLLVFSQRVAAGRVLRSPSSPCTSDATKRARAHTHTRTHRSSPLAPTLDELNIYIYIFPFLFYSKTDTLVVVYQPQGLFTITYKYLEKNEKLRERFYAINCRNEVMRITHLVLLLRNSHYCYV